MAPYETTEILTDEDIDLINNFVEKPNLRLLIFMLIFTALSYFASQILGTYIPLIFFGIFTGILASWYFWMKYNIARFTSAGTKKLISGSLENKFESTVAMRQTKNFSSSSHTFGYFVINGNKYMVPYKYYDQFKIGDKVVLHLTVVYDIVFKIN